MPIYMPHSHHYNMANILDLVEGRMLIGRTRYEHGLLHPTNENMNFHNELVEELLDAVVYAAANVVKHTPQVSSVFNISDEGSVKLRFKVNYELERDGADAIVDVIKKNLESKYDFSNKNDKYIDVLLLCIFALQSVLKYN